MTGPPCRHSTIAIPRNWMLLYPLRSQPRSIEREVLMQVVKLTVAVAFAAIAFAPAVLAQGTGIERMYILECGQGHTGDMSRWTPGQNARVAGTVCAFMPPSPFRYLRAVRAAGVRRGWHAPQN